MNNEEAKIYWTEWGEAGLRMYARAQRELGRLTVDEMLLGEDPPITNENWPGATDMGEYLDRPPITIHRNKDGEPTGFSRREPDIKGREL